MAPGGATESSLWFTDGHACMHGTHSLGGHSCGLELLRLLIFLMGLKVYTRTLGNAEVTGTGSYSGSDPLLIALTIS